MTVPFDTAELQILDNIGVTSKAGAFTTPLGIKSLDCRVHNAGIEGAYVVFDSVPTEALNKRDGASGSDADYIAPGETLILSPGPLAHFSAVTDSGLTTLYFHSGKRA